MTPWGRRPRRSRRTSSSASCAPPAAGWRRTRRTGGRSGSTSWPFGPSLRRSTGSAAPSTRDDRLGPDAARLPGDSVTIAIGGTLGRYRLDALLGRGGMAEVFRATDTKLARTVAVKVILATHAVEGHFLERFLREARMVASLEHPNILPVYDFGEESGVPFLVMPYLPGGSLRDRLKAGPVPLAVASSWIVQLSDALDAAHAAGVLHRDVKPANVLLGKDDRLFLADFGIAKLLESQTGLTATGVVVGTPIYMAPEQAQGHPASPATDRYALAVVAFEILAGRPPFEGDSVLSLMHQHVATPPPMLSMHVG